jgi:hypothetical protein
MFNCVPFFFSPQTVITRLDAAQVYLCRGALLVQNSSKVTETTNRDQRAADH